MAPLLLASKADKILTSSLFVSDTNVSVFLMPASVKISWSKASPLITDILVKTSANMLAWSLLFSII